MCRVQYGCVKLEAEDKDVMGHESAGTDAVELRDCVYTRSTLLTLEDRYASRVPMGVELSWNEKAKHR